MKLNIFKYAAAAGLVLVALTGCQDNFDDMTMETPVDNTEATISIADFKAAFWLDDTNYCEEIPAMNDSTHYIIKGRVISSDYYGNIFKCLYIQDETAVLPFSINQYNLYLTNRVGQEIVVDLTGMYAGKYNGMFQMGFPEWYETGACWETSFMAPELFNNHRQYNGNPEPEKIDTIVVADFSQLSSDTEGLQKWQGQLVRFNNAKFANAGVAGEMLCDEYHSSGYNQSLNVEGGAINVRTSGYAKFWNTPLPENECDVVGILSYYGTSGWQLLLNDINGLMNIGNPTVSGAQDTPYTVEEAINLSSAGTTTAWVKGYIVGTLKPGVYSISSNDDIQWEEPYVVDNYLVIGQTPETRDYTECMLVPIADDSALYTYGNLADNPGVAGLWINILGKFTQSMGMAAVTNNNGTVSTFEIEGLEIEDPTGAITTGDGSEENPYNTTQVIALDNPGTSAWVTGYIVGVYDYDQGSIFVAGADTTVGTCIAIALDLDGTDVIPVQLPSGSVRTNLNLVDHPENLGKKVSVYGSLVSFYGNPGVKETSAYKLSSDATDGGDDNSSLDSDAGTKDNPLTVAQALALGSTGNEVWIEGYIIGCSSNGTFKLITDVADAVAANIVLADSADETETVIPVQLSSGSEIRVALNLKDNPENLGKKVKIQGTLTDYFSMTGLKNTDEYVIE